MFYFLTVFSSSPGQIWALSDPFRFSSADSVPPHPQLFVQTTQMNILTIKNSSKTKTDWKKNNINICLCNWSVSFILIVPVVANAPSEHQESAGAVWLSFFFACCLFPALMISVFMRHPLTAWCGRWKHLNETPHCEVVAGSVQRSLYIQLLSLLPWQGKERKSSTTLQPFPHAAFTSRRCHGDRPSEHDCAVRQTCRKGRRDVVFSPPPPWLWLCCVRGSHFRHHWSTVRINGGTCGGMCAHRLSPRPETPASGVCGTSKVGC